MKDPIKLLLVNPSQIEVYGKITAPSYLPLGLAYLGAFTRNLGHEVKIFDIDAEKKKEFAKIVKEFSPDFIGFTATTPTFNNAISLINKAREISHAKIILGGIHATIMPEECEKHADHVVIGEGELALQQILEGKAGKFVKMPFIENLDELPFPIRDFSGKYTYPDALFKECFPIITSRGCIGQCTFCCTKQMYGTKFRYRSAKNIVDEIEYLIKTYKAREIHIWDDCFTLIKNRVFEIRDEIKNRNIQLLFAFPNGVRVDYFDEEIASALKDMGTYSVAFGIDSGNQKLLDFAKKNVTLEQSRQAVRIAKKFGFETWGFFMMGLPFETKATIKNTVKFAKELELDIAKFHILKPFPKSEVYEWLNSRGLIFDRNYAHYGLHTKPVHELPDLTPKELIYLNKKAYREFYMRPKEILKQVFRLRSWNRIKVNVKAGFSIIKKSFA
ncbi:MAG TPA: radical SAM protein [Candidatus Lokiarchaeia archaeon]|nr:radical SAM protein [Candidatus Lokiarchaeia archaeon]